MRFSIQILWVLWIIISLTLQQNQQTNNYSQLLNFYSFDFTPDLLPKAYYTFGAGIRLKNRVKLIPSVGNKIGAVFLKNKFRSNSFTFDYTFKINSSTDKSDGFILWYLHQLPSFDTNSGRIHGVNQDTNGLGIRLYKTENNKWRVFSHYDRGEGNNLENASVRPDNSWTLMLDPTKVEIKLRVEKLGNKLSIFVTDDNAKSQNWRSWVMFHNEFLNYQGYLGFTAGNTNNILNDIDILSIMIYDNDPNSPYATNDVVNSAEVRYVDFRNEPNSGPTTAKDILHTQSNSSNVTAQQIVEFKLQDNKEQLLLKAWETLRIYNLNMANLIKTLRRFDKDKMELLKQSTEDKRLLSVIQNLQQAKIAIDMIGNSLVSVNDTVTFLSSEVKDVKSNMSKEEYDITQNLVSMISNLNFKIDSLQTKMQSHESYSQSYICCSYNIPPITLGKGYIKLKKNWLKFSKKYTP